VDAQLASLCDVHAISHDCRPCISGVCEGGERIVHVCYPARDGAPIVELGPFWADTLCCVLCEAACDTHRHTSGCGGATGRQGFVYGL
jgi:hypothetical protein